jgi:hypothetical protein
MFTYSPCFQCSVPTPSWAGDFQDLLRTSSQALTGLGGPSPDLYGGLRKWGSGSNLEAMWYHFAESFLIHTHTLTPLPEVTVLLGPEPLGSLWCVLG